MVSRFFLLIILILFLIYKLENNTVVNLEKFTSKSDILIIIPLRNREKQLNNYLEKVIPILKKQNIDYKIIIVDQTHKKEFNRGKLLNIGFLEGIKINQNCLNIYLNDVDNYPLQDYVIDYNSKIKTVKHIYGHTFSLGGLVAFNKNIFKKINGFSNNYFGWGHEDEDLITRVKINNIDIDRSELVERGREKGKIFDDRSVITKRSNYKNGKLLSEYRKKYAKNKNSILEDGLITCKYNILKNQEIQKNVFRILVDI